MKDKKLLVNKFLEELKDGEISPPVYNAAPFAQGSGWNSEKYFGKYYNDKSISPLIVFIKDGNGVMYYTLSKMKNISKEIFKKSWENKNVLKKINNELIKRDKEIDRLYDKFTPEVIEKTNITILLDDMKNIMDITWEINSYLAFTIYFDENLCLEILKENNIKISMERIKEIWYKGTKPIFDSFDKRRNMFVLNLLKDGKNFDEIALKCQYFGASYNYVSSTYEIKKKIIENYNISKENVIERIEKYNEEKTMIIDEHKKYLKNLNENEKKLVNYIQEIIYLRDIRKDFISKYLVVIFRIAQKIFKENNISEDLIYYYTVDEFLKGKQYLIENKDKIVERKKGFLVLVNYDNTKEFEFETYDQTKTILDKKVISQSGIDIRGNILFGKTGSIGKVTGKVKIIKTIPDDEYKFQKGDILVTGMTRPEFTLLMKKAAAIVTDEGSITSHASIVSRELKIPCVIGTKIATKILHDGDLVEVDADKGIVKILEKSK